MTVLLAAHHTEGSRSHHPHGRIVRQSDSADAVAADGYIGRAMGTTVADRLSAQ
ncbi:MAG: hypothetical protein RIK87_30400 [Fuerstiella sp.]